MKIHSYDVKKKHGGETLFPSNLWRGCTLQATRQGKCEYHLDLKFDCRELAMFAVKRQLRLSVNDCEWVRELMNTWMNDWKTRTLLWLLDACHHASCLSRPVCRSPVSGGLAVSLVGIDHFWDDGGLRWRRNNTPYITAIVITVVVITVARSIHCVPKNVTTLSHYYSDIHKSILIIFATSVTGKVGNHMVLYFPHLR